MKVYLIKNITNKDIKYKDFIIKPNTVYIFGEPRLNGVLMLLEKRNLISIEYNDNFNIYGINVVNDGVSINAKPILEISKRKKRTTNTTTKTEKIFDL
jgi:hypothetical protein